MEFEIAESMEVDGQTIDKISKDMSGKSALLLVLLNTQHFDITGSYGPRRPRRLCRDPYQKPHGGKQEDAQRSTVYSRKNYVK